MEDIKGINHNYPYFPIFLNQREYVKSRDDLYEKLKENNIFGRRYFYTLISNFPIYRGLDSARSDSLPVAEKFTKEVICLPVYPSLEGDEVKKICRVSS